MKEETKRNNIGSFFGETSLISELNKWIRVFNDRKKQKEKFKLDESNFETILDELNELIQETNDRKKQRKKTWKEINELYLNDKI
jgi:hypothetical protein